MKESNGGRTAWQNENDITRYSDPKSPIKTTPPSPFPQKSNRPRLHHIKCAFFSTKHAECSMSRSPLGQTALDPVQDGRKWLVNHCPPSHLGTWWTCGSLAHVGVVAVLLRDSCGAQCLKVSSNVWHMLCVSSGDVRGSKFSAGRWLDARWMRHRWGPINEPLEGNNTAWATLSPNVSKFTC